MARRRNFEVGTRTKDFLSGDLANGIGTKVGLIPARYDHYDQVYADQQGKKWADRAAM